MIYVNGCSYAGYPSWSWGHNLASMLNKEIYFAATPGKSNQSIIRETIIDLTKLKNITHVVISLTFINRFDVWYNNEIISINPGYNLEKIKNADLQNYIKSKSLFDSTNLDLLDLFSSLVSLKYYVESLGAKFFVFWAANEIDILTNEELRNSLLSFKRILDKNSFNLFDFNFCLYSFNENYFSDEKYFSEETEKYKSHAHPPPSAHKKLAEMIYDRLK